MTLVSRIQDLVEGVAVEFNGRPITKHTNDEPDNPQPGQFWVRPSDGAILKYSIGLGFVPVTATTTPDTIVDGGNF